MSRCLRVGGMLGCSAAVVLVACGGSTHTSAPTSPAAPSGTWQSYDPQWTNARYADCMRQHRVPVNGPDSYGDLGFNQVTDREAFLAAQKVCEPLWPPSKAISIDEILRFHQYQAKLMACVQSSPGPSAQSACRAKLGPAPEIHGPKASRS